MDKETKQLRQIIDAAEKTAKPTAEELLLSIFRQCTAKNSDGYITWYIDDQWVFKLELKNERLWCYYFNSWKVFETDYNLDYPQIQKLQRNVVGVAAGCKEFTAYSLLLP